MSTVVTVASIASIYAGGIFGLGAMMAAANREKAWDLALVSAIGVGLGVAGLVVV